MPLVGHDCLQETDDLLLSGGYAVDLASHLSEAIVDVVTQISGVLPQIDEVVSESVETGGGRLAKIANLTTKLADVSVRGTSEDTCCRSVPLT